MKKIILILLCLISSIKVVNAVSLVSEELPYYVKLSRWDIKDVIIKVNKVYDKDTLEVVFNTNIDKYNISNNFNIYNEYDFNTWNIHKELVGFFNTIVYYGYLNDKTDLNYFLTQVEIWTLISNYNVSIVDINGNIINDYDKLKLDIRNKINTHITQSSFFNKTYNSEIWTTTKYEYDYNTIVLDNPIIDGLTFTNNKNTLYIYNDKVGDYKLTFNKEFIQDTYCYSDGFNTYLKSTKGPNNIYYSMNYNVYGIKLNIKENLIGINNKLGDSYLDSTYELYLDNELKLTIDTKEDIYIKSNSSYILKDISNNDSINNIEDINFSVIDNDYTLEINKYVISKNISLDINSNKTYYVYLKSNDELYEVINNNIDLITLPYGLYYIKDNDNTYYKEILVDNDIDELLSIEDVKEDKEEIEVVEKVEEIKETEEIEEIKEAEEEIIIESINIENPHTFDDIYYYVFIYFTTSLLTIILYIRFRKE